MSSSSLALQTTWKALQKLEQKGRKEYVSEASPIAHGDGCSHQALEGSKFFWKNLNFFFILFVFGFGLVISIDFVFSVVL